jgi:pyruvate,water dikinase
MAALVQEMVPATAAGVAFSADPLSGISTVIIEAVPHLADELVQGRAEPDRFVIDPRGALSLERRIALGTEELPVAIVLELGTMVREIAAFFGTPQDVEWVWDGTKIFILQSRAITSLVGQHVYSRKLVGDMAPGPIKPLVWSTNTLGMVEGVFGEIFTDLIGKNDYDFKKMLRRIRSRAYADTTFVGQLLGELGLPKNLFEAIAREERVPKRVDLNWKLVTRAPSILRLLWLQLGLEKQLSSVLRNHEQALGAFREADWGNVAPTQLIPSARELLALHRGLQRCIM